MGDQHTPWPSKDREVQENTTAGREIPSHKEDTGHSEKVGLRGLMLSIAGAAFGVQSSKTHRRDFNQVSPKAYIVGGIIFGVIFVAVVASVVSLVLSSVG